MSIRINQFIAQATGLSRRAADKSISNGDVEINSQPASLGQSIQSGDIVKFNGQIIHLPSESQTIVFYKPTGYVVSRNGQGGKTIYSILPENFRGLKPVGRLDKNSSGLLLLTTDGNLANHLLHPRYSKTKKYEIELDKPLDDSDKHRVLKGVSLIDGNSSLNLVGNGQHWQVTMSEGRNRQIRRTFLTIGYKVTKLHRTEFGPYTLSGLQAGEWRYIEKSDII